MSTNLVVLAVLMFAVTYPTRALGLLTPGLDRLPTLGVRLPPARRPGRPGGAGGGRVMVRTDERGATSFHIGIEWVAVLTCLAIVAWRRNCCSA